MNSIRLKPLFLFLLILPVSLKTHCQEITTRISTERLINDVFILASDSLEGRQFPSEGKRKAAGYIAGEFEKAGLQYVNKDGNRYFQKIPVIEHDYGSTRIYFEDELIGRSGNYSFASTGPLSDSLALKVIFKGYVEPADVTVTGDDIMIHLVEKDIETAMLKIEEISKSTGIEYFAISLQSKRHNNNLINAETRSLQPRYPESLFGSGSGDVTWLHSHLSESELNLNVLLVGENLFEKLYSTGKGFMNVKLRRFARNRESLEKNVSELTIATTFRVERSVNYDQNVIGYIEGGDLKDEYIIICGHYDHLGKRGDNIYYGADDNASGTAGVMEVARMFAEAKENGAEFRRTIVFIAFGAEETGLNGSTYYVSNPVFPIDKTKLVVNMDMIGRSDVPSDRSGHVYVRSIGGGRTQTRQLFRTAGGQIDNLRLLHSQSPLKNLMWRFGSDHYPFVRQDVPAIVVTTGTHPDYHLPADTPEKINYRNMVNILKAVFAVVLELDTCLTPWAAANPLQD